MGLRLALKIIVVLIVIAIVLVCILVIYNYMKSRGQKTPPKMVDLVNLPNSQEENEKKSSRAASKQIPNTSVINTDAPDK